MERELKIAVDCFEVGEYAAGVGRVIHNILISLLDIFSEHDFFVFTRKRIERYDRDNVRQFVISSPKGYFRWQNGPFFKKLMEIKPDLLLASNYTLPFFNSWKSILFEHDISFASHPEWFSRKESIIRRFLVKRSLKKADVVVTGSEFSKNEMLRYFPLSPEKINVIFYGVEEKFRRSDQGKIQEWKEGKGLENNTIIGYLGAMFNRRNIPLLVESIDLLRKDYPETVLYVVGEDLTRPHQDMENLLDKEWIRWETHLKERELPLFYSSVDVFAYLSEYEGFGLPPLEALSCGTVSVLLNRTSLKEIYQDMAIMVDEPSPAQIKKALVKAITDRERKESALSKFQEERHRFSWNKMAHEISSICMDIVFR
jgi:glycosyltransferase involved in cell wall biosynthesis